MNQYEGFNRLYQDFILTLISYFPHNTQVLNKIQFYHELLEQFIKKDCRLPGRLFLSNVGMYAEYIFNKNEEYFKEIINTNSTNCIEKTIINEWDNMSELQKNNVWFYLQRLLFVLQNIDDDNDDGRQKQK